MNELVVLKLYFHILLHILEAETYKVLYICFCPLAVAILIKMAIFLYSFCDTF